MHTYKLEQLIRKIVPDAGVKILPTFRRLADKGELTPELMSRWPGIGITGTIEAFRLIGYCVEKRNIGNKEWVIKSKGESTWF